MTFTEFLKADGQSNLVDYMNSIQDINNIPDIFFNKLEEKLKSYFIIGGMPEVIQSWITYKDMERVNKIQEDILQSYESDFSKHTTSIEANRISIIWNSIPSQIARENKKFLYQAAKNGARAREYEDAVNWLKDANVVNKIYNVTKPNMPLIAYNDLSSFKLYLNDVGLLRKKTNLSSRVIIEGDKLFQEFKGALTENYVLQTLVANGLEPYYHIFDNRYEIDFIIQHQNEIIPIEVKVGKSLNNTSLKVYNEIHKPNIRIRFSMNNLNKDDNLINIPLFMAEYVKKIVEMQ